MKNRVKKRLVPYLSPTGAWAFSLGAAMGWGAVMVTGRTYLAMAGPLGSVLGILLGCVVMLVIARNYHYMMNRYPQAGGSYAFARNAMGHDQGYVVACYVVLTYLAMLWANATALPLYARYFVGDIFEFGHMYRFFGYDVYLGEALLAIAVIVLVAFFCCRYKNPISWVMVALVVLFTVGIMVCFVAAVFGHHRSIDPQFVPTNDELTQILNITVITPWAFIGFENIAHGSEEFKFDHHKSYEVLSVSIVMATILYISVTLMSVMAYPSRYGSWLEYINDLPNLSGIEGIPAFYAAQRYLGRFGIALMMLALLALILTSLVSNIFALSRVLYSLANDRIISPRFSEVNKRNVPQNAIIFIVCVSALIPFVGRVAVGWIVDVSTLGATLIYGFISAATFKLAMTRDDTLEKWTGLFGFVVMVGFQIYILVLNVFTTNGTMDQASYFLFVMWSILGILYYSRLVKRDKTKRFGNSLTVWVALMAHLLLISMVWMSQAVMDVTHTAMNRIQHRYVVVGYGEDQSWYIDGELDAIRQMNAMSFVVVVALFALAIGILLGSYRLMRKRASESRKQLDIIEEMANTDPMTGVRSKHAYAQREQEIDNAIEAHHMGDFAVVVCDVNGLKFVNDTYGHKAGDAYIKSASEMIGAIFKHSMIYRTGGDEFVVYLTGRDYRNRADLLQELHDQSVTHIAEGTVVVSGGMSDFIPDKDHDVHSVFERADALMYQEKMNLKSLGAKTRE